MRPCASRIGTISVARRETRSVTAAVAASTECMPTTYHMRADQLRSRPMRRLLLIWVCASCCPSEPAKTTTTATATPAAPKNMAMADERHFGDLKQITFGADNAEAYWSFAGDRLIFQTNRAPYKCDQIEEMPANGGPATLVSTGKGRTTCSYFLKGDKEIIYASTHDASPDCPKPPDMTKGYNWG